MGAAPIKVCSDNVLLPDYRITGRPRLELRAQRGRELDGGPATFRISEEDI